MYILLFKYSGSQCDRLTSPCLKSNVSIAINADLMQTFYQSQSRERNTEDKRRSKYGDFGKESSSRNHAWQPHPARTCYSQRYLNNTRTIKRILEEMMKLFRSFHLTQPTSSSRRIQLIQRLWFRHRIFIIQTPHSHDQYPVRLTHITFSPQRTSAFTTEHRSDRSSRIGLGGVFLGCSLNRKVLWWNDYVGRVGRAGDLLTVGAVADRLGWEVWVFLFF